MDFLNRKPIVFSLIFLGSFIFVALPIFVQGLPSGLDIGTDLHFAASYRDSLLNLHVLPSWTNDSLGFGSLGTRLYPPLAFYGLAVTQILTNDWFNSLCVNFLAWMFVGSIGIFKLIEEFGSSRKTALVGALLYVIIPQHLSDVFQIVLFAQFAACGILPFCFLYAARLCSHRNNRNTISFAATYALLILCHIPTTIIFSVSLPLYCLGLIDRRDWKRCLARLLVSFGLAAALTSFYWIKVLIEFRWAHHNDPRYSENFYSFNSWLIPIPDDLQIEKWPAFLIGMLMFEITIGLTALFIIPVLLVATQNWISKRKNQRPILAVILVSLLALFMMSRPSYYVWYFVPILEKIQFPWRWLSVLSVLSVVGFSIAISYLISEYKRYARAFVYPAIFIILAVILFDVSQLIQQSTPYRSDEFNKITTELETTPIWEGWLPIWAHSEAFENQERVTSENRSLEIVSWEAENRNFTLTEGVAQNIRINTFYYPFWHAKVNGNSVDVAMDQNGTIVLPIPAEKSNIHLYFAEPTAHTIAFYVSFIAWFFLALAFANLAIKHLMPIPLQSE